MMRLQVRPTATRYVDIYCPDWDARWQLQFPESIVADEGWIMEYHPIHPDWKRSGDDIWEYAWLADAEYVTRQQQYQREDTSGRLAGKNYLTDVGLDAELAAGDGALRLSLTLHNRSPRPLHRVSCDGGCFQAKSPRFAGREEIARTFIRRGGALVSMASLHRSVPIRCAYYADVTEYDQPKVRDGEWFWGRSVDAPDVPVIVGMSSSDGGRGVVMGYAQADAGSANADEHHCIHSSPRFGDVGAGQSARVEGWILFGKDVGMLAEQLHERLTSRRS